MRYRGLLIMVTLFFVLCGVCFAAGLTAKEAVNYYNKGVEAQRNSNFAEADINYQKTLLVDPNNSMWQKFILNNRGVMYAQVGDPEKAEASFKAALGIDSKYKPAITNLTVIYEKRLNRCQYLEYIAKLNEWDKIKPAKLVMSEESAQEQKRAEGK